MALTMPASVAAGEPDSGTGGASVPSGPAVSQVVCDDASVWTCRPGATVVLEGEALSNIRQVRFVGRRGRHDDRVAVPARRTQHQVEVRVPVAARSGPVAVVDVTGARARTARWLRLNARTPAAPEVAPSPAADAGAGAFPIAGAHTYGTEINRFGGGRGHGGQDVFAACGTPLVAVADATVLFANFQSRAGNYVVLKRADGESYAYMHMQQPTPLKKGDAVRAGQRVGLVGDTGRASGCHLHFEQWTAPGWQQGGTAVDPLPLLRSLDR